MIKNQNVSYRTPRILTHGEVVNCRGYIEKAIIMYVKAGYKSFTVKDIFGYDNWNWSEQHPNIQCIYDAWVERYIRTYPKWPADEIYKTAYKQAGISLGHLFKQAARNIMCYTFEISNPSGWNIVYKVV